MKNCKRCNKEIPRNNYCSKCYTLNFRERNPGRMEELCSIYYEKNKDRYIERAKKRNKENPEIANATHARWAKRSNYTMNRYNNDINFQLRVRLRNRLRTALKLNFKSGNTVELLGCSLEEFKQHLESKFEPGMTWQESGKWHIDHIRPVTAFDLSDPAQQRDCCHYTNLQPMWVIDNIKKGGV